MFNSISGTITGKFPQKILLDNHGIEWEICVPDSVLDKLPPLGEEARVFTWLQHTDALMVLYGFAQEADRALFFDLLKVDGIGPKAALKIMSNISTGDLAHIVDSGDVDSLQKVPGVGKKTAAKMMLQLKGKLTLEETSSVRPSKAAAPYADVVAALVNMGYERRIAEQKVSEIAEELSKDASFARQSSSSREDTLFRRAIVELAQ